MKKVAIEAPKVDREIVERVLQAAPTYPGLKIGKTDSLSNPECDGFLDIEFDHFQKRYQVEVQSEPHLAAIHRLIGDARSTDPNSPLLLVAEFVRPNCANLLKETGLNFLDAAGNAHLTISNLYLYVTGNRPAERIIHKPRMGRIFQRNGLILVFSFLTDPELDSFTEKALLNRPFREISKRADISLGSIGAIIGDMEEQGFLVEESTHHRQLVERRKLLEKWVAAYTDSLRPKLISKRYHSNRPNWWQNVGRLPPNTLWGGEVAAAKMTGYLKPQVITLYSDRLDHDLIINGDLRIDPKGEVEVLTPFWGNPPDTNEQDCTHPLLVYADLLASGIDRNVDTAQRIYDKFLRKLIDSD